MSRLDFKREKCFNENLIPINTIKKVPEEDIYSY
jgi:hypothetical protein